MADDQTFRLILALGMAAFLPVAVYHRVRSQASGETLDRREEGLFILLTLRPLGLAAMGGLVAFVLNPAWMAWASLPLPVAVRWAGVAVGVPTVALGIWTFRSLGRNITDTVVTRREHTLVTGGPYRFVRHPFYVTTALGLVANALTTANGFIAVTGAAALALMVIRTATEEAKLVERFGDDYRRYMARTGRFFPRLRSTPATE
ncbi:MAG: isoprenylcysteine carboxylmethyltransferase family protein [Acidobacteria bacterium]|nr:isoprenylcysteine carboxylmethyltransferase family protein [Acidobacteriota bacterium]